MAQPPKIQPGLTQDPRHKPPSAISTFGIAAADYWEGVTRRLASMRRRRAFPVIVTGVEKHSQKPLTALYFGSGLHLEYLLGLTFDTETVRDEYPVSKSWRAAASVREHGQDVDLVFLDLPWPYHRLVSTDRFLVSPSWLQQRLSLKNSWEEVVRSFRKNTRGGQLRKIRRYELDYRVTRDPSAAASFYDDFYRPHLAARFGGAADYMPRSYVESCISSGALLQVIARERVLGAVVLYPWGNCLQLVFAGLGGDIHDRQFKYVFAALYYFSIKYGFEQGFRELDMTGSRPLLNDGLLRFKRQWGASLHDGWTWGLDTLLIRPNNFGGAVRGFLKSNPWIVRSVHGLVGKVLLADGTATGDDVKRLVHNFGCEGLQEIAIFSCGGFSDDARHRAAATSWPVRLIDLASREDAADIYCRT